MFSKLHHSCMPPATWVCLPGMLCQAMSDTWWGGVGGSGANVVNAKSNYSEAFESFLKSAKRTESAVDPDLQKSVKETYLRCIVTKVEIVIMANIRSKKTREQIRDNIIAEIQDLRTHAKGILEDDAVKDCEKRLLHKMVMSEASQYISGGKGAFGKAKAKSG